MRRTVSAVAVLGLLAAAPVLAQAVVDETRREAIRGVPDRWGLTLGSFWQTLDTKIRLDGTNGEGTEINLESDLGLKKSLTDFQLNAFYRFSDRSRLDLSYLSWSRNSVHTIDQAIEWGDVTYDAGAKVATESKARMINAIYKYSFFNNGKVEFGLNGGISALWNDFTLSGEGTVSGEEDVAGTITGSNSTIFPIPVLGVHFEMTLAKRLLWQAEDNFFVASVSDYDGNVNEFSTSIAYYPTRSFGLGAGFASTSYTVTKSGSDGAAVRVRYAYNGVIAYMAFTF
jgi:hypothetical protein